MKKNTIIQSALTAAILGASSTLQAAAIERESVTDISFTYYDDHTNSFDGNNDFSLQTTNLSWAYWDKDYSKITESENGYISFGGLSFTATNLDLSPHPLFNKDETYYTLRTSLNLGYKISQDWQVDGFAGFVFNIADSEDSTKIEGELEAGVLFRYKINPDYKLHLGAEASYDFDGVLPTLAIEYSRPNYTVIVGLPKTAFTYQVNDKLKVSLTGELQGKRGYFYHKALSDEKTEFQSTAIHTHLSAAFNINQSFYMQASVGYLFSREIDIESTSLKLNESSSDGITYSVGLKYEW